MKPKQKFTVRFFPKTKKATKDGKIPLYATINVEGLTAELSIGEKIDNLSQWNVRERKLREHHEEFQRINLYLLQIQTSLHQHFQTLSGTRDHITPDMVKTVFLNRPVTTDKRPESTTHILDLDEKVKGFIERLTENVRAKDAEKRSRYVHRREERLEKLTREKEVLETELVKYTSRANRYFDDYTQHKSLLDAFDEFLLQLLRRVIKDVRSFETLRRWPVTRNKVVAFLQFRYKSKDIKLGMIQFKFADQFYDFLITQEKNANNTAMKHIKNVKQILDRAVNQGWISQNVAKNYKCVYDVHKPISLTTSVRFL